MIITEEQYLAHHGVKGMKWGVRKDRDSAGKARPLAVRLNESKFGRLAEANNQRYIRAKQRKAIKKDKSKVGMTPDQATLAVYGGLAVAVLLARGAMSLVMLKDSGRKDAKQTGEKEFKQNPKLKGKMSVAQLEKNVVKQINPDYPGKGTQMNCRRATLAYEMRRRGYDVKSTKSSFASGQDEKGLRTAVSVTKKEKFESGWGQNKIAGPSEFAAATPQKRSEMIFDALGKQPNGSRGELCVGWTMGGGHSMAYEVVNKKPVIFDTQSSKTYDSPAKFSEFATITTEAAHTRLDTATINDQFIKRWVTDA